MSCLVCGTEEAWCVWCCGTGLINSGFGNDLCGWCTGLGGIRCKHPRKVRNRARRKLVDAGRDRLAIKVNSSTRGPSAQRESVSRRWLPTHNCALALRDPLSMPTEEMRSPKLPRDRYDVSRITSSFHGFEAARERRKAHLRDWVELP